MKVATYSAREAEALCREGGRKPTRHWQVFVWVEPSVVWEGVEQALELVLQDSKLKYM